jgi:UDP-N-acetylglucosamine 4,6-dehydratase
VISSIEQMVGGEIFIPKIPSVRITELASVIAPDARQELVGIRPGEKLHEVLLMSDEARHTIDCGDRYAVLPEFHAWSGAELRAGAPLPDGFVYSSDTNEQWLDPEGMTALFEAEVAVGS